MNRLAIAVAILFGLPAAASAGGGWSVSRRPSIGSGAPEYTASLRDEASGGVLMLQCTRGVASAYVTAMDDLNVFVNRGERATVYLQVGTGPTTGHGATFLAKRDGRAVFEVDAPGFVDRLADGEVRMMVNSNNARYLVAMAAEGTDAALAPVRACKA